MNISADKKRLITLATALAVVLGTTWFAWSQVSGMFAQRYTALETAQKALRKQQQEQKKEQRRQRDLRDRIDSTLAADNSQARTNYKNWLVKLVTDSGLTSPNVTPTSSRPRSTNFQVLGYKVKAKADLAKVVDFLVKFYQSPEQHQIRIIRLNPIQNSKLLDVDLSIEVMAGKGSKRLNVLDTLVAEADQQQLREMADVVVQRNCFGDANIAPKLDRVRGPEVEAGSDWQLNLVGKDENALDVLRYSLVEGPEGLQVDEKTGAIAWQAAEPGEYPVKVAVADDGLPSQRTESSFVIKVVEAAPVVDRDARPSFDHATQAFVVATVVQGDQPEAWVSLRTTGKMLRFKEGSKLTVGSVKGEVEQIGRKDIHVRTAKGRLRVPLGSPLTGGKMEEPVASAVETSVEASDVSRAGGPESADQQF